jgi:hypothetical protein
MKKEYLVIVSKRFAVAIDVKFLDLSTVKGKTVKRFQYTAIDDAIRSGGPEPGLLKSTHAIPRKMLLILSTMY